MDNRVADMALSCLMRKNAITFYSQLNDLPVGSGIVIEFVSGMGRFISLSAVKRSESVKKIVNKYAAAVDHPNPFQVLYLEGLNVIYLTQTLFETGLFRIVPK